MSKYRLGEFETLTAATPVKHKYLFNGVSLGTEKNMREIIREASDEDTALPAALVDPLNLFLKRITFTIFTQRINIILLSYSYFCPSMELFTVVIIKYTQSK